jgi:uncharacterized membrane protein YkoI
MRRPKHDDTNIQVGIFIGADWKITDIAKHLGVSTQAIHARKGSEENRIVIDSVAGITRVALSKYIETRVRKMEEDFEERKKRLHTKGYKVIEKTLDHALAAPKEESPDQTHLKAAEMGIERVEGKALDRKAILSRDEHVYRIEVDGDDLDSVLNEVAIINEMRKRALTAPLALPPKQETA